MLLYNTGEAVSEVTQHTRHQALKCCGCACHRRLTPLPAPSLLYSADTYRCLECAGHCPGHGAPQHGAELPAPHSRRPGGGGRRRKHTGGPGALAGGKHEDSWHRRCQGALLRRGLRKAALAHEELGLSGAQFAESKLREY